MVLDELKTDLERAEFLQNIVTTIATSGGYADPDYKVLRRYFIEKSELSEVIPSFIRTSRDTPQFWSFIKNKHGTYQERREFIWNEFAPLMDLLEGKDKKPSDLTISDGLKSFDEDGVNAIWTKALERRKSELTRFPRTHQLSTYCTSHLCIIPFFHFYWR